MDALSDVQRQRRSIRWMSWSGAALVAAILFVLNFIASYAPIRFDTSAGRVYSISQGSKDILKKLDDRLIARVIFSKDLPPPYSLNQKYVEDLLSEYRRASHGKIRLEFVSPGPSSQDRQEAMMNGVSPVQLDVRESDRREVKECYMGISFQYGDRKEAIGIVQDTANLEYEISSRLRKLIDPTRSKIGLVISGESLTFASKPLESLAAPIRQLYDLEDVDLSHPVPSGLKAVWVIAPSKTLDAAAVDNLSAYASSGGVVGLLLNRYAIEVTQFRATPFDAGLDRFLALWGLHEQDGLVVDPQCDRIQIQAIQGAYRMINVVDYPYFPWVNDLNREQPSTKGLDGLALPFVSPIETTQRKPGFTYTSLARTSKYSYLDTKPGALNPLAQHSKSPQMPDGPFEVATMVQGSFNGSATPSRLVVVGTSRFIESEYPVRQGNYSFLANLMDWSVQDEVLIQIRSRGYARRPLKDFSDAGRALTKLLMVATLPIATIVAGIIIWRRQKIRRMLLPLRYQD